MLVLTRKNRESVVIGRGEDLGVFLEITVLEIEGGRVRLGFQCDAATPIHRREVWERICNGNGNGNGHVDGHVDVPVGRRLALPAGGVQRVATRGQGGTP